MRPGRIALDHFRKPLMVDYKADDSPVTVADRTIESYLRGRISETYPDHGVLGEEEAPRHTDRKHVWVIDPIDGTKSFVTGHPLFGGLIGLLENGRPCLGQIDIPVLRERYVAARGGTTTVNGVPCRTSDCADIAEAVAYTTDPFLFRGWRGAVLERLRDRCRMLRLGGDCYCYALLASGSCDIVLETGLEPYDYLPVVQIVEGAGGVITDWQGNPLGTDSGGDVLAGATPGLHAAMLEHLHARSGRADAPNEPSKRQVKTRGKIRWIDASSSATGQ